jgi:hypothetical protein
MNAPSRSFRFAVKPHLVLAARAEPMGMARLRPSISLVFLSSNHLLAPDPSSVPGLSKGPQDEVGEVGEVGTRENAVNSRLVEPGASYSSASERRDQTLRQLSAIAKSTHWSIMQNARARRSEIALYDFHAPRL